MSDWSVLLSEMSLCEPPADLTMRVLGEAQRASATKAVRPRALRARPLRRPLSIGIGLVGVAALVVALAIAAHSRRATGPMLLTSANLLSAIQAHGFGQTSRMPNDRAVCQRVRDNRVEYGYEGILKDNPSGFPQKQVSTVGIFQVMPSAAIATACARELINETVDPFTWPGRRPNPWKRLSTNIFEVPNEGGPGSIPILRHGNVRRDGDYQIIAARGRILLIGMASDRPDAFALDRLMKSVASSLRG